MRSEIEFLNYGFRVVVTDGSYIENTKPERQYIKYNSVVNIKLYFEDKVFVELNTGESLEFTIIPELPLTYDISGAYSGIRDFFDNIVEKSDGVS